MDKVIRVSRIYDHATFPIKHLNGEFDHLTTVINQLLAEIEQLKQTGVIQRSQIRMWQKRNKEYEAEIKADG